jgi:hypothetical protein
VNKNLFCSLSKFRVILIYRFEIAESKYREPKEWDSLEGMLLADRSILTKL